MKTILKKIAGKFTRIKHEFLPKYFIATPFLSSLYYFLFSNKFRREQHSVLSGKVKHLKESKANQSNIFTLVRNIHRIEKGLLMKPKREVFAVDYITETTDAFVTFWNPERTIVDAQYKWFFDVLFEYFQKSGEHPVISKCAKKFNKATNSFTDPVDSDVNKKAIPYFRLEADKPNITYEEFYRLTRYRRSVRWFLDKKVPQELIDKAILAANQSPSACNRQPFEYYVIDQPDLLKEVIKLPMGVTGYAENIPMLLVAVGSLDAYFDERDRHLIYIDASLANMSLMLALETLGLSSCSINWPDIENLEKKMSKSLDLKSHQRPIMCMAVGYPDLDGKVAYSEKKNIENLKKVF